MLCRRPFMLGSMECPCGGCLPCRINRRRVWSHRILLESYKHGDSCFATLTYDDEHLPDALVKRDYQTWLKRLRRAVSPRQIRYFLAGEFGELSGRPHFHVALFGLDVFSAGGDTGRSGLVSSTWGQGFTFVGSLTWESAQYIAGYLTKKVLPNEYSHREFCRMSLRPGIGSGAMRDVAQALSTDQGLDSVAESFDVPSTLSHGRRLLPLGRYLRRRLRGELGFASKDTPSEATRLYVLRQAAEKAELRSSLEQAGVKCWDAHKIILDMRSQKLRNIEARMAITDSKRSLV